MAKTVRYPLQLRLERFASSRKIKLREMSPEQVRNSNIRLDEFISNEIEMLDPDDENENPVILIGKNEGLSLSYLGFMAGYSTGKGGALFIILKE